MTIIHDYSGFGKVERVMLVTGGIGRRTLHARGGCVRLKHCTRESSAPAQISLEADPA
jgi:hypothetical protein